MQHLDIPHLRQPVKHALARSGLDEREETFAAALIAGRSMQEACDVSRYSLAEGYRLLRRPIVQAAIAAAIDASLRSDLAPLALVTARKMIASDKTADGARTTLILGVLDRAGYSADRFKRQAADSGRDVTQMKAEELRAEIDRLQREIEGRAIDVTPNDTADVAQALDMFE